MSFRNIEIVVFDCDGVLFDTTRTNTLYYNRLLERFGLPAMTPEQFAYCHMHTADGAIKYLFEGKGLLDAAQAARREMNYRDLIPKMEIEPDLIAVLNVLRSRYRTAVATNRSDTMDEVLEVHDLVGRFDLVVTARDVDRPKPAPDMLLNVLDTFGLIPAQAVYVGDSALDEEASSAANIPFIAFRNESLQATAHVDRLTDILGLLNST